MGFYPLGNSQFASAYGPIMDHGHEIPALDLTKIDPEPASAIYPFSQVRTDRERSSSTSPSADLYLVQPGGMAIRYTVGVGREEALNFRGSAVIGRKAEWPHWSPTGDMICRMPIYAHYVNGLPGGIGNPLGARALYLYRGNQDTYFRLHGTNEPDTIGDQGVQRMHSPVQSGHHRSLQPRSGRRAGRGPAGRRAAAQRQRRRGWLWAGRLWSGRLCSGWLRSGWLPTR